MTAQIPSFNNRDKLSTIRNNSINPAIQKVNALEINQTLIDGQVSTINTLLHKVEDLVDKDSKTLKKVVSDLQVAEQDLRRAFTYATIDGAKKLVDFSHKHIDGTIQSQFNLDLSEMFAGITESGIIISNGDETLRGVNNSVEFTGAVISKDPDNPRKAKVTVAAKSSIEGGMYVEGQSNPYIERVTGVSIKGNVGDSGFKEGKLEIDLPHLSIRDDTSQPIKDVEAIRFAGANVTRDPNNPRGIIVDSESTISVQVGVGQSNPLTKVTVPEDSLSEVRNSSGGTSQELTISQLRASIEGNQQSTNKAIDTIHIEDKSLGYITGSNGKTNELHIKRPTIKVSNEDDTSDVHEGYALKIVGATVTQEDNNTVKVSGLGGLSVQENKVDKGPVSTLNFEESFQYLKPGPGTEGSDVVTIKPMTVKGGANDEHNIRGFKVESVSSSDYIDTDKYFDLTKVVRDGYAPAQLLLNISHDAEVIPKIEGSGSTQKIAFSFNPVKSNPAIVKALISNFNGKVPTTGSQILKSSSQVEFVGSVSASNTGTPNSISAYFAKDAIVNEIVSKIDSAGSNVTFQTKPDNTGVNKMIVKSTFNATIENGDDKDSDKPFDDVHVAMPGSTVLGGTLTIRGLTAEDADGNSVEFDADGDSNPQNVVGRLKAGTGIKFEASTGAEEMKAGEMVISVDGATGGTIKGRVGSDTTAHPITKIWVENGEFQDSNATLKVKGIEATVGGNTHMVKSIEVSKNATSSIGTNGKLVIGTGGSGSGSSGVTINGKNQTGDDVTQDETTRINYGEMFAIGTSGTSPNKEASISFNKKKLAEVLYSSDSSNTILKAGSGISLGLADGKIEITNTNQGGGVTPPEADNKVQVVGTNYEAYDKSTGEYKTASVDQNTPKIAFGKAFDTEVETSESGSTIKVELADLLTDGHYAIFTTPPFAEYTLSEASGRKKMPYTMLTHDPMANMNMDSNGHFTVMKDGIYDLTVCAQVIGDGELFSNLSKATLQVVKCAKNGGNDEPLEPSIAIQIYNPSEANTLPKAALHTFKQELLSTEHYYIRVEFGDLQTDTGKKAYTPAHMNYLVVEPTTSETKTGYRIGASQRALMSGLFLTPGYAVATAVPSSGSRDPKARVVSYSQEIATKSPSA